MKCRTFMGGGHLAALSLALAIPVAAQNFSGSIFTSDAAYDVNVNQFTDPNAVYLDGGPQNDNGKGLPVGLYYYQVTNSSGSTLLSTDSITCRVAQVTIPGGAFTKGVITGGAGSCPHPSNPATDPNNGSDSIQLMPFGPSANGVYKVWFTAVGDWNASCGNCSFGFDHSKSKTDNFKINCGGNTPPGFCTQSPPQSQVSGQKFFDLNTGNTTDATKPLAGILEPNDIPLINWTIHIYDSSNTLIDTEVTDAGGAWSYFAANNSTITVCEVLQTSWTQSGPPKTFTAAYTTAGYTPPGTVVIDPSGSGSNCWQVAVGTTPVTNINFGNYLQISGTKYYSTNGSDPGSSTIANWPITVTCDASSALAGYCANNSFVTAADGTYLYLPQGPIASYKVCEGTQTNWTQSYPNGAPGSVTVKGAANTACTGGEGWAGTIGVATGTGLDFGNYASITGTKYYTGTTTGLANWTINLNQSGSLVTSTTTASGTGKYSITVPSFPFLNGTVCETLQSGWTETSPTANNGCYTYSLSGSTPTVSPSANSLDFYNDVVISGYKFYGTTGSGLSGWTINLIDNSSVTRATATTSSVAGSMGAYSLTIPSFPFTGTICETNQAGWTEILPDPSVNPCYSFSLTSNTVPSGPFNFENVINLSGLKFYDFNLDKIQDNGEAGIGGIKIAIYSCAGAGCTPGTTPIYVYTTANGGFKWTAPASITNYKVCEVLPPTGNWTETTTPACYSGTVGSANQSGLNFGNVCEGSVLPYTQGFWHNNNGHAMLTLAANYPGWATAMDSFNNNTNPSWPGYLTFVPTTTTTYGMKLFTGASASNDYAELAGGLMTTTTGANAANMLSTQLATMELNTLIVTGTATVPAPKVNNSAFMKVGTAAALTTNGCSAAGIPSLTSSGYATILDVMTYANSLLQANPNTTASSPARSCQAFIQTALNNANNNQALSIIQPVACTVPTY